MESEYNVNNKAIWNMESSAYSTDMGRAFIGDSLDLIKYLPDNSIDLVMTSPPFALQRPKEYGNKDQADYVEWLGQFGKLIYPKLKDEGSLVIDIGGAYQKGSPTRSLYNYRVPIHFVDDLGYFLAEDFYWYNPAKLPSPIEWVNKRKIRVKDSVNNVWWFSKTEFPKANVNNVLAPYSDRMKKLLSNPEAYYDAKKRPSGHDIGKNFGTDNGGAIPSNLLQYSNTESVSHYIATCKRFGIKGHPARFPAKLPEFFIKFLTDPGDTVLDIFGGSNTTGYVAESIGRKWLSFDLDSQYVAASVFRFLPKGVSEHLGMLMYNNVLNGIHVDVNMPQEDQPPLNVPEEENPVGQLNLGL
jgi:site-specific DNA-methyltransferase (cytosine-N4-specific)